VRADVADQPVREWVGGAVRSDRPVLSRAIVVLLVFSLLEWRMGDYYSGGIDPVVAGKALVGVTALALSWYLLSNNPTTTWVGARTVGLCCLYLAAAAVGGLSGSSGTLSNVVLIVRVVMVLATMLFLTMAVQLGDLIDYVTDSMAAVGIVLAVAGLPSLASKGRLSGGILPINPNQLAVLFGPFILAALWRMLREHGRRFDAFGFVTLLGLTWLTGSRTGLVALLVALMLITFLSPRLPVPAVISLVLAVPAVFYLLYLSPLVSSFFDRGGTSNVTTLNSRTIAWSAALSARVGFWRHWFGGGLGVKEVAVSGTYWDTQVLDSSWLSAFVQVGVTGVTIMSLWIVLTLLGCLRAQRRYRGFLVAATMYAVINSVLMTGLLDAYVLFVVMLLPAFGSEVVAVQRGRVRINGLANY
jgi:hypothetical protein